MRNFDEMRCLRCPLNIPCAQKAMRSTKRHCARAKRAPPDGAARVRAKLLSPAIHFALDQRLFARLRCQSADDKRQRVQPGDWRTTPLGEDTPSDDQQEEPGRQRARARGGGRMPGAVARGPRGAAAKGRARAGLRPVPKKQTA